MGKKPLLIGEGLHILNPLFVGAVRKKDPAALLDMAGEQIVAGAGGLAVNLGPGKAMAGLTPWAVTTLADGLDVPLFVSSGVMAMPELLEKYGSRITVNAVTAEPGPLAEYLETARRLGTRLAILLVRPGLVPAGTADRLRVASEVIAQAVNAGTPLGQLYLDPVIACRPDPFARSVSRGMPDMSSILETLACLGTIHEDIRTIAAMSSSTEALPPGKKTAAQAGMLDLLAGTGLDAVILNCLDRELMAAAERPRV
jgi:cobalamin-dependent methionine synthase I